MSEKLGVSWVQPRANMDQQSYLTITQIRSIYSPFISNVRSSFDMMRMRMRMMATSNVHILSAPRM